MPVQHFIDHTRQSYKDHGRAIIEHSFPEFRIDLEIENAPFFKQEKKDKGVLKQVGHDQKPYMRIAAVKPIGQAAGEVFRKLGKIHQEENGKAYVQQDAGK